jgi:hypothetical protein
VDVASMWREKIANETTVCVKVQAAWYVQIAMMDDGRHLMTSELTESVTH